MTKIAVSERNMKIDNETEDRENQFKVYTLSKENNGRKQKEAKKKKRKTLRGKKANQMRHFNEI